MTFVERAVMSAATDVEGKHRCVIVRVVVLRIVDAHHLIVEASALSSLDLMDVAAGVVVGRQGHDFLVLCRASGCSSEICVCGCWI